MTDLDALLSDMRDLPLDPRLDHIDDVVLAGVARRAQLQASLRAIALVATLSLGVGIAGSVVPAEPVQAAVFPLGAPAALAPSTLLDGGE